VQTCWSKNTTAAVANTATVRYDVYPFVCQALYRVNNQPVSAVCGNMTTTATSSNRPWFRMLTDIPNPNYTYQWSPVGGASNLATVTPTNYTSAPVNDVYTVTVSNSDGCSSASAASLVVNPQPTAVILSDHTVICSNDVNGFFIDGSSSLNETAYLWLADSSTA